MKRKGMFAGFFSLSLFVMAGGVWTAAFPETDAARAARFQTFFGANKAAKIVWQKETSTSEWCSCYGTSANLIMKMDSRTGTIDTLVRSLTNYRWGDPSFTWDGSRVVYYDNIHYKVRVVNWDGTADTALPGSFNGAGRCWRSTDGKDYALVTAVTGSTGRKLIRMHIDSPFEKDTLLSTTWAATNTSEGYCNTGTHWVSMSPDGNYIAGNFPEWPDVRTYNTSSRPATIVWNGSGVGCWASMARDNTHRFIHFFGDHQVLHILNVNGSTFQDKPLPAEIISDGQGGLGEAGDQRWSNDPDYVTVMAASFTNNPYLLRVSDMACIAVNLGCTTAEGNSDAFVYDATSVAPEAGQSAPSAMIGLELDRTTGSMRIAGLAKGNNARISICDASGKVIFATQVRSDAPVSDRTLVGRTGILLYRIVSANGVAGQGRLVMDN